MEKANKRKAKAVALATAAVLVLAGTIAYLADASGTIRNVFDNEHIRVQINETGVDKDAGDKGYTVLPGTTASKDPTITVDTDTDAYVFAVVKDTINSHTATGASEATKFVNYTIADGWTLLDEGGESSEFGPKTIKKYVDILNNKTDGNLTVNPRDSNTKIYYRIVHGSELANGDHDTDDLTDHRFTFNLLTNDQISYPTTLTNEDMNLLNGISKAEDKALIFQTWAIQMEPFCPADEVATADQTKADQMQYAKDAWNETTVVPTGVAVSQAEGKTEVGVGKTLPLTATVTPKNAVDKTVTWSSSDTTKATVDANGVVTGVAAGTVTITATATAGNNVTDTYDVTVTAAGPTFGYAVQYKGTNSSNEAVFWPAMGAKASGAVSEGVTCGNAHCIHNDSWADIKAHPEDYTQCITNGCTKKVLLDETKAKTDFGMTATTGDGGGIVTYAPWGERGTGEPGTQTSTYGAVLTQIAGAMIDGPSNPSMFLLSYEMLGEPTLYEPDDSRIVYNQDGGAVDWWLSDPSPDDDDGAYRVNNVGYVNGDVGVGIRGGIAPGFRY